MDSESDGEGLLAIQTRDAILAEGEKAILEFKPSLRWELAEFASYALVSFREHSKHTMAIVSVEGCPKPVYLKDKDRAEFYVRAGNTPKLLDVEDVYNTRS